MSGVEAFFLLEGGNTSQSGNGSPGGFTGPIEHVGGDLSELPRSKKRGASIGILRTRARLRPKAGFSRLPLLIFGYVILTFTLAIFLERPLNFIFSQLQQNALFAGHDTGAQNWAKIASLFETCKLNAIEPRGYLSGILTAVAQGHKQADINELLPWNFAKTE